MRKRLFQKAIRVSLILIMFVLISGCASGPPDEETSRLIAEYLNWDYYEPEITILGKEYCGSRTGDEGKGITERWLVVYRIENYQGGTEGERLLVKKDGEWQVEEKTWWGPPCPPP